MKVSIVAQFIAEQIEQGCDCHYSASFIANGQIFCASKDNAVYQAQLISTDNKTALDIRNITQQWVLSRPTIVIGDLFYQVDPDCSTAISKLGATSCGIISETQHNNHNSHAVISVSVILVGMVLLVFVGSVIISLCYLHRRKSKGYNMR